MKRFYRSIGLITLGWLIGSCGGGDVVGPPPPPTVATVALSTDTATLVPAATVQLSATAKSASGEALQRSFSWTSSDVAKVTVSSSGMVVGVAAGVATITAAVDGKSATATITVLEGGVVSSSGGTLTVQSGAVQIVVPADALASNTNLSVVASTAFANDPRVVKGTPFEFGPAGTNFAKPVALKIKYDVANLLPGTEESALEIYFHDPSSGWQVVPGSTVDLNAKVVSAQVSHFSTYATLTPIPAATVTVTPATASVVVGGTQQLTATLRDAANNVLTGRTVTWSSSNTAVATVDPATGLVSGVAPGGPVTITATSETKTGTSQITVSLAPVNTVTLSALTIPMVVGGTQPLTATTIDAGGTILTGRSVNWVSSNTSVLTVSPMSGPSGTAVTVTAVGPGTATITATSESKTVTTPTITVNPAPVATVTVSPATASLVLGITPTQQLTAETKDASGTVLTGRLVTWTSSNAAAATVDGNGLVTAIGAGSTTITATSETKTGTSSITVTLAPVATVTLSAPTTPMVVGATQVLTAVTKDSKGNVLTGRTVSWVSSNPAVLSVSPASSTTGTTTVTAAGVGTATITATSESVNSAPAPVITVTPVPVNTVTVSPTSASLAPGGTQQLSVVTKDASGNVLTGRTVTWSSDNTTVATVSATGLVTGVAAGGPVTITATSEGKTGTSSITVTPAAFTLRASPFITSGLNVPVFLTQPLNDGRIFVVELPGIIRVVQDGVLQTTTFLDISSKVSYSGERGLLSVAFHPQYATNHYFYVYFTGLNGEIRIERFTTTSDPSVADPASEKLVFTTPHDVNTNHNGGLVAFGPDGMLYAAFGDGGGTGDPAGNAQKFDAYLGGMIRIDIDNGDPYSVPADNPFVGQANKRPELWAKGLRNPWRYAFDAPTGLLFIADVGQSMREEVDVALTTQGGLNYGWNIMEGSICYNATTCDQTGLQLPVLDYATHVAGTCSVIGGYVYHGSAMPAIQGHYFYSDYCAGWVRSFRYQNGAAVDQKDWGNLFTSVRTTSFGQDAAGELYVMSANSVYKLIPGP